MKWLKPHGRARAKSHKDVQEGEVIEGELLAPDGKPTGVKTRARQLVKLLGDGVSHREHLTHKTTAWSRYQWREQKHDDAAWVREGVEERHAGWALFARELFADLLEGPGVLEECDDVPASALWAKHTHAQLDQVAEWRELRALCQDDPDWSSAGAQTVATKVREVLSGACSCDPDAVRDAANEARDAGDDDLARALDDIADDQQQLADADAQHSQTAASAVRQAARAAAGEAVSAVVAAQGLAGMLGIGRGVGVADPGKRDVDLKLKARLAQLVSQNTELQRIVEMAGLFVAASSRGRIEKVRPHAGAVVDVVKGDDVARLTPRELGRLANPATQPAFYADLVERKLLCYEMEGEQRSNRGPIIFLRDCSGSMSGAKDSWSKGVLLAVAMQCRKDKRDLAIGHYNGALVSLGLHTVPHDAGALLDELLVGCTGGTNLDEAMRTVENSINDERFVREHGPWLAKADYIFVTDGDDERPSLLDDLGERRALGVFIIDPDDPYCDLQEAPAWAADLTDFCEITVQQLKDGENSAAARVVHAGLG